VWAQLRFETSVSAGSGLPPGGCPEIAFAGRSNVGKSSAINALANRKRLAFVSRTPGRTRTINFFDLGGQGRLVDLPGYGYARAAREVRGEWERLVAGYLASRPRLAGLVLLMDARHPLAALDRAFLRWLEPVQAPHLVLLAKSDKLSRAEASLALARTLGWFNDAGIDPCVLLFSSKDSTGMGETRAILEGWLREASPEAGIKGPR
jgi:GTP-binding protein